MLATGTTSAQGVISLQFSVGVLEEERRLVRLDKLQEEQQVSPSLVAVPVSKAAINVAKWAILLPTARMGRSVSTAEERVTLKVIALQPGSRKQQQERKLGLERQRRHPPWLERKPLSEERYLP
jgi:hypothetical protein